MLAQWRARWAASGTGTAHMRVQVGTYLSYSACVDTRLAWFRARESSHHLSPSRTKAAGRQEPAIVSQPGTARKCRRLLLVAAPSM